MSQFLSSKLLKYRAMREAEPIQADLACRNCGYNVRGLRFGRNCPECGSMIEPHTPLRDVLLDGDHESRRKWRLGLILATAAVLIYVLMRLGYIFGTLGGGGPLPSELAYVAIGAVNALIWVASIWLLTPAELDEKWKWMHVVRVTVRILAMFWIVAYSCAFLRLAGGNNSMALALGDIVCRIFAGVGALVFVFMLAWIAGEAELESAAKRLTAAIWFVPFLTAVQVFLPLIPWVSFRSLGIVLFIPLGLIVAWVWATTLIARGTFEMEAHIRWADRHAQDGAHRSARIDAQRSGYDRTVASKVRPLPRHDDDGDVRLES